MNNVRQRHYHCSTCIPLYSEHERGREGEERKGKKKERGRKGTTD